MTTIFPQLENAHGPFTAVSVGQVNGLPAFARMMQGFEGPFHIHAACDEMFIVLSGVVHLDFESSSVTIGPGQSYTVPAGVKHRSRVPDRAELIVIGGKD